MATAPQVNMNSSTICVAFKWIFFVICVFQLSCAEEYCAGHFERCVCTKKSVECRNETNLIENLYNLYPMIKDHVKSVIITGSKFENMSSNFFGSCHNAPDLVLKELTFVDLSNNQIKTVNGKTFHCMPNLKTLKLSNNQWQIDRNDNQIRYFTSLPNLKSLDLTNTFEDVWDGTIHVTKLSQMFYNTDMSMLEDLKLGYNEFKQFTIKDANSLCELTSLRALNLTHNNLIDPSMPTKQDCFKNLTILDLSFNKIETLTQEFMIELDAINKYDNLMMVKLEGNPFRCDCWLVDTWNWLNTTKVPIDKHSLTCGSGFHSSYIDRRVLDLTPRDLLCENLTHKSSNVAAKVVTGIIFTIIGVTLVAFMIIHRAKLRQCLINWKKKVPSVQFRSHQGYSSVQEVAII